jgi:hypothetical protein
VCGATPWVLIPVPPMREHRGRARCVSKGARRVRRGASGNPQRSRAGGRRMPTLQEMPSPRASEPKRSNTVVALRQPCSTWRSDAAASSQALRMGKSP